MSAQAERIQTGRLREDPVSKLLLQFSFPAIMAMPVLALYNMVDRIFIGNYPPTAVRQSPWLSCRPAPLRTLFRIRFLFSGSVGEWKAPPRSV